jgi:integrase/recombinase XerC
MERIAEFLQYLEYERRYSPHTIDAYRRDLLSFSGFLSCKEETAVDFRLIRRWVVALVADKNTSRTVNRKISALRVYYKYLVKKEIIAVNPMDKVGLLKIDKNLPIFVVSEKMNELLDDEMANVVNFDEVRDKMILEIFYMTGIRLSELIHLNDINADTVGMTITVTGKGNKERIIPLTVQFNNALRQYISIKKSKFPDADRLFVLDSGKPLYAKWVQRLTSKNLGLVTTMKKRSPHVLRHSFATNILDEGAELNAIKEILGHANLSATQIYTHSSLNRIKKVYNQAHPRA